MTHVHQIKIHRTPSGAFNSGYSFTWDAYSIDEKIITTGSVRADSYRHCVEGIRLVLRGEADRFVFPVRWARGAKSLTLIAQSKTIARLETMAQRLSP
jgi:hypothetical protein